MDATRPRIMLNGEELQNINPDVTLEGKHYQFAPTAATRCCIVRVQRQRIQLQRAQKAGNFSNHKEGKDEDTFFPFYVDGEGSFQAYICFMP